MHVCTLLFTSMSQYQDRASLNEQHEKEKEESARQAELLEYSRTHRPPTGGNDEALQMGSVLDEVRFNSQPTNVFFFCG